MDYIQTTLGLEVTEIPWEGAANLPYLITDRYDIKKVTIGSVPALAITLKADFPLVDTLEKHIALIRKAEACPVFLVLTHISKYKRDGLIGARIPFVVPGKQLYLPFLGVALKERCDPESETREKLLPSAQAMFFYYLYSRQDHIYLSDAAQALSYSPMSISRAARQLLQTGLFLERKEGVRKLLAGRYERQNMFHQMEPLLVNPVKRRIYVSLEKLSGPYCIAGFPAMAHYTMLSSPQRACYAADVSKKLTGPGTPIHATREAEVQIWKYDPAILSQDGVVDPLSLILSLRENADERTEEAIEEIMDKIWER